MTTIAEVKLWGNVIGAVSLTGDDDIAPFQYAPAFSESGIEVLPLMMPLSDARFSDLFFINRNRKIFGLQSSELDENQ